MRNYKAGSILVKFTGPNGHHFTSRLIKLRHFRNRAGNTFTPNGGHTVLFDMDMGIVVSSTCHPKDKFSRKAGTDFCIRKWVDIMKNDNYLTAYVGGTPMVKSIESDIDVINVQIEKLAF